MEGTNSNLSVRSVARSSWYLPRLAKNLSNYVAQESSLPEEQRISDPPLEQMAALAERVRAGREARTSGQTQREVGVEERSAAVTRLLDLLQIAAVVLVGTRYDGRVTNDLQQWGYTVVAR